MAVLRTEREVLVILHCKHSEEISYFLPRMPKYMGSKFLLLQFKKILIN